MPTFTDFLNIEVPDENDMTWTATLLSDVQILDGAAETISGTHLTASGTSLKGVVDVQGTGSVSIHPVDVNTVAISGGASITEIGDLDDVDVSGIANNQILKYNSTSGNFEAANDETGAGGTVDDLNAVTGSVLITGTQNTTTQTVGQTITITGPDLTSFATSSEVTSVSGHLSTEIDTDIATHAADVDAHHAKYTDAEAISATESARFTMSGTLSTEIDSDVSTHAAISDAHHSRYTDSEAVSALEPTTSALAASGVATDATHSAHAADADAHHAKYTDAEAVTALEPTTSALAASGVATDATFSSHAADTSAHHARYSGAENDAIVAGSNVTVVSGTDIITISSTSAGGVDQLQTSLTASVFSL